MIHVNIDKSDIYLFVLTQRRVHRELGCFLLLVLSVVVELLDLFYLFAHLKHP